MFDLPLDPQIGLQDTIAFNEALLASGAPINEDQHAAEALFRGEGRTAGNRRAGCDEGFVCCCPTCRCAPWTRSPPGPTSPDHSTVEEVRDILGKIRPGAETSARRSAHFFEREDMPESPGNKRWRPPFFPKLPWPGAVLARRVTAAATMTDEDDGVPRFGLRNPALKPRPGGECAHPGSEGRILRGRGQLLRRLGLRGCGALPAGAFPCAAGGASAALPDFGGRGDGDHGPHSRRRRPQPAIRPGLRAGIGAASR